MDSLGSGRTTRVMEDETYRGLLHPVRSRCLLEPLTHSPSPPGPPGRHAAGGPGLDSRRDDLPASPDPAARDFPRPPGNLSKAGLIALLRGWKLGLAEHLMLHGTGRHGLGRVYPSATRWLPGIAARLRNFRAARRGQGEGPDAW